MNPEPFLWPSPGDVATPKQKFKGRGDVWSIVLVKSWEVSLSQKRNSYKMYLCKPQHGMEAAENFWSFKSSLEIVTKTADQKGPHRQEQRSPLQQQETDNGPGWSGNSSGTPEWQSGLVILRILWSPPQYHILPILKTNPGKEGFPRILRFIFYYSN